MCRFIAYKGAPLVMHELLYEPDNSLIHQSYHAQERSEPLNGDGFGIGWYVPGFGSEPAVFVSTSPAWNNRNLRYNASKIRSGCMLAHVRAASTGDVSEANCHPFHYRDFLMMHNGQIGEFKKIKRPLRTKLSDERYHWIQGSTDSEHFFALFLDFLHETGKEDFHAPDIIAAIEQAIATVIEIGKQENVTAPHHLNLAVTNGHCVVALRYCSDTTIQPPTLYHSIGSRFSCEGGVCRMRITEPSEHAVLIVSEKLTAIEEDWHVVPPNHFVIVRDDLHVSLQECRPKI